MRDGHDRRLAPQLTRQARPVVDGDVLIDLARSVGAVAQELEVVAGMGAEGVAHEALELRAAVRPPGGPADAREVRGDEPLPLGREAPPRVAAEVRQPIRQARREARADRVRHPEPGSQAE